MSDQRAADPTEEAGADREEKIEIDTEKLRQVEVEVEVEDEVEVEVELEVEATKPVQRPKDPAAPIKHDRAWWHRYLEPEERQRILAELGIKRQPHWEFRFATMLGLSVVVAVMGLSADSAAVVIGAMLLAPLMQPVLAAAACISMALFKKSLRAIGIVVVATVGSIALSFVLSVLFVNGDLPNEVLSRTAPDIRDLVVALGAGTAGAYATVRKDVSSSLPGVAVAVALVPPLGAVGIALEAGRPILAVGALLLYITNLAAIVFAASIVFVATGFVPPKRLRNTIGRTAAVAGVVAVVVAAIAVPLYSASRTAVKRTGQQLDAIEIVKEWLGPVEATDTSVEFRDRRILVRLRSFEAVIDDRPLTEALQGKFGSDRFISLEWEKLDRFEPVVEPTTKMPTDAELLEDQVEEIVNRWLQAGEFDGVRRVDAFATADGVVRVDASGVGESPSVSDLTIMLDEALDVTLEVQLTWVERRNITAQTPDEIITSRIKAETDPWASDNQVTVVEISYNGTAAIIEVAGDHQPDATALVSRVEALLPATSTVTVLFTKRLDITTTTTTTTTIPASTTTTTP